MRYMARNNTVVRCPVCGRYLSKVAGYLCGFLNKKHKIPQYRKPQTMVSLVDRYCHPSCLYAITIWKISTGQKHFKFKNDESN